MSTDTIPTRADEQTIDQTWFNILQTVLGGDLVPRNGSGATVDQAGSLGTSSYRFLRANLMNLLLYSTNTKKVTLVAPSSLPGDYTMTLPLVLPPGRRPVQITESGILTFAPVSEDGIEDDAITLAKLRVEILNKLTPTGSISAFGGSTAPTSWLLCDGTSYLKADYPALYAVIGNNFGHSGASFNVPDFRGNFLRGVDSGISRDPDRATRFALHPGGNTGDTVGSFQPPAFERHTHIDTGHTHEQTVTGPGLNGSIDQNYGAEGSVIGGPTGVGSALLANTGGNETRPVNVNVNFIIKT